MSSESLTFQKSLPLCEAGDRVGWHFLLQSYSPIALRLISFYLPEFRGDQLKQFWREVLTAICGHDYERLRSFDHLSEREFLVDLRAFLLDFGAGRMKDSALPPPVPPMTPEVLAALLQGLRFAHQEVVFLKLAGYSDAATERIAGIPPSIASQTLAGLEAHYAPILHHGGDCCPWPVTWLNLIRQARAARTAECVARRLLVRIADGQTSWSDKSPSEAHLSRCLHCMESWIALREISFLRRDAVPLPPEDVNELLSGLCLAAPANRGSFLRRIFGS